LYSFENLYHPNYDYIIPYLTDFDLIIGINDIDLNNYIRIPAYLMYGINNYSQFTKKNKNICMVSKNPHNLRIDLVNKLKDRNVIVDCGGSLLNNIGYNVESKYNFLLDYYFNICPENSYAKGYCTEKIYQALQANCIPVYWGDLSCDNDIINTQKILHINKDLSNIDLIIDQCVYLLNNKNELHSILNKVSFDIYKLQNQNISTINKIKKFLKQ